jgi:PAS domain-containing protein
MNTEFADRLMMRVDAARRRLTELDSGRPASPQRAADALKVAVREVDHVQDALLGTTEQLHIAVDELEQTRKQLCAAHEHYAEFRQRMPLACLLTDACGSIGDANHAAAELLNVAARHLIGKAMLLFLPLRDRYFQAIDSAKTSGAIWLPLQLKPRERKARPVMVAVFALPSQGQYSWLISTESQSSFASCASPDQSTQLTERTS